MLSILVNESNEKQKNLHCLKRTLSKIIPLCLFALLFTGLVCSVANDVYAFVKKDREVSLVFDSCPTLNEFSKTLAANGIVSNPDIFRLYVSLKDKKELIESFSGELKLNSSMSYREILSEFS